MPAFRRIPASQVCLKLCNCTDNVNLSPSTVIGSLNLIRGVFCVCFFSFVSVVSFRKFLNFKWIWIDRENKSAKKKPKLKSFGRIAVNFHTELKTIMEKHFNQDGSRWSSSVWIFRTMQRERRRNSWLVGSMTRMSQVAGHPKPRFRRGRPTEANKQN